MNKCSIQKRMIAFAFVTMFCIETFCSFLFIADYYLQTPVYAANCINKDKPQMHCNGKCQLQKKLNEENNKDKQNTERKNEGNDEVISSKTFFASVETPFKTGFTHKYLIIKVGRPVDQSSCFFRPPRYFFM